MKDIVGEERHPSSMRYPSRITQPLKWRSVHLYKDLPTPVILATRESKITLKVSSGQDGKGSFRDGQAQGVPRIPVASAVVTITLALEARSAEKLQGGLQGRLLFLSVDPGSRDKSGNVT